jgi:hypothetical protein
MSLDSACQHSTCMTSTVPSNCALIVLGLSFTAHCLPLHVIAQILSSVDVMVIHCFAMISLFVCMLAAAYTSNLTQRNYYKLLPHTQRTLRT